MASITQNGENLAYTYDDAGNILSEQRNSTTVSYEYDALGQLVRVNDPNDTTADPTGTTWVYTYDQGGNILSKAYYPYTTGSLGTPTGTVTYTYGDSNWKDKLTAYNGTPISYDAIGNPTSDGTWTYTWEKGRQLKQMTSTGTTAAFDYNADGLRVRKTVNGITTNYILHGKNIVHLTQGSDSLHFYYDAQNRPAIVDYNGTLYRYIYNLQGDVLGLLDNAGNEVVRYTYDAWGKVLSVTGTLASTVGAIQPFRYRGYVYDVETGLYYLRSRYYNPTWSRCANADDLIVGNLYCYCNCNPIGRIDTSGHWDYSAYKEKVVESWFEFLREVIVYSIKSVNNPRVYTVSTFLQKCRDTADAHNLKYTNKSCAAAIAHHLEFGMSETGMTSMMRNDIIVAIEIANPEHGILLGVPQKALIPGAILMQIDWKDPDGRPANHGGIVAEDLNAYQSSPSSKVFCHQDLYTQPWTHMGWHKGVRLDDWVIVLCEAIWPGLKELEGNK